MTCDAGDVLQPDPRNNAVLSYSPDGTVLAIGATTLHAEEQSGHPPELWDPATGKRLSVLDEVDGIVVDLGYSGDGSLLVLTAEPSALVVISADGTMTEGPVTDSTRSATLAVGPGTKTAVLHSGTDLMLWDRSTGEATHIPDAGLDRVCWSPDEQVLYGLSRSEGVAAWDGNDWRAFDLP